MQANNKLKILFVSAEYPPETGLGGIGTYVASIAPVLAGKGHQVHVLSCFPSQRRSEQNDRDVYIHRRDQLRIPGFLKLCRLLRLTLTSSRILAGISTYLEYKRLQIPFDIIEYPDWGGEGWLFPILSSVPLVSHIHTPLPLILKHNRIAYKMDAAIASHFERFSVVKAHVITAPSVYMKTALHHSNWLTKKHIDVIPYPIDHFKWSTTKDVLVTSPVVLFIGRLERLKAPEILVYAMQIIRKRIPEAEAIFVGRSNGRRGGLPYGDWVKHIAEEIGNCSILGHVASDQLRELISKARVVAVPSWHDNFPNAALEAMASGRPVVASINTGISKILEENNAGKTVPPGDAAALAEALIPFMADPKFAANIGRNAQKTVIEFCDPNKIASKREHIYRRATSMLKQ